MGCAGIFHREMKMHKHWLGLGLALMSLAIPAPAGAQSTHICDLGSTNSVIVTVGSTLQVVACFVATVEVADPLNPSGPKIVVPHRIDGLYAQIDATPAALVPLRVADVGPSPVSGLIPYIFSFPSLVTLGAHDLSVWAWNWKLDADRQPTSERQEGNKRAIVFTGVKAVQTGPPFGPRNTRVIKP